MSKPKLGSGARFRALVASGKSPALAAYIGRKKYGRARFAELSRKGHKANKKISPARRRA